MKKVISIILAMVLMVTSLSTYCMAYEPHSSEFDVNSIVNADFIKEYGSYVDDNDKMNSFFKIMSKKNVKLFNETAEKIAKGDIKLDKNISHNAELTEVFLKKIYDKDNIDYFRKVLKEELSYYENDEISYLENGQNKELKNEELEIKKSEIKKYYESLIEDKDGYLKLWYFKCPVLIGMVNTDIMTYLIHTDPESKEIIGKIEEIEQKTRTGIDLYINKMDLTDVTKQSMKDTLKDIKVKYYGINEDFDSYFEHINREELMKDINSDNETFFNNVAPYFYLPKEKYDMAYPLAVSESIYQPNAFSFIPGRCIIFYPAMFLCKDVNDSNSDFNLEFLIRFVLSHEFGHFWNSNYIQKDIESREAAFPNDSEQERKAYREAHPVKEICSEDMQKLEMSAQNIIDEFNDVRTNLKDDDGKEVKIDGLRVYREAAADNFALNSMVVFAKKESEDLSKIFFTFARFFWGTYNIQSFIGFGVENTYPPNPYRVNMGLKLCKQNMAVNEIALDSTHVVTKTTKLESGEMEFWNIENMNVMTKSYDGHGILRYAYQRCS